MAHDTWDMCVLVSLIKQGCVLHWMYCSGTIHRYPRQGHRGEGGGLHPQHGYWDLEQVAVHGTQDLEGHPERDDQIGEQPAQEQTQQQQQRGKN